MSAMLFSCSLLPAAATAQSSIVGAVQDASGAVLPGVTVEAASPALIEKLRTTVTDGQGRYVIANLRPGTYRVTFALAGFSTQVRENLVLPADFAATVNASLTLGEILESVTVTGAAPVVDVASTQRTAVLGRELLDTIPTGRTFAAAAYLVPGIKVSEPNVGGARAATQQRLTAYGSLARDTTVSLDGFKSGTIDSGGDDQADHNDAMTAELTVGNSGAPAEIARGGVHINLVPREGGNLFAGQTYFGYSNNSMQSDNLGDLGSRGLQSADAIDLIYYVSVAAGGPVVRDRIWFFGSYGNNVANNRVANSFWPDGRPGVYDQRVQNYSARLTWQINQQNKLTGYVDYPIKYLRHRYLSGEQIPDAAPQQKYKGKYVAYGKWTAPVTNSMLIEAGYLTSVNHQAREYQPGIAKEVNTPAWYATATHQDLVLGTTTIAPLTHEWQDYAYTYLLSGAVSYIQGSHAFKTGVQWTYGTREDNDFGHNASLIQRYRTGVPDSVTVFSEPNHARHKLNADLGIYAQDSWRLTNRLTLTPGVRFEYLNAEILATSSPPSRFSPGRSTTRVPNLPNWFDVAPRFGVAYDLTGDARTVIKGVVNKYLRSHTVDLAERYNPMTLQSENRNWSDCDYIRGTSTCSGLVLPTNGDDIAQDNEIGPSGNARFGTGQVTTRFDPDSKRPYDVEYSISVEREVLPSLAVAAAWFKRESYNLQQTVNTLVGVEDWIPFTVTNPLTLEPLTIYNLDRAKLGLVDLLDTTADRSNARYTFDGMEVTFRTRLPNGATIFGGWSAGKHTNVSCANFSDPNTFLYCDQGEIGMPYRHSYKLTGSYPLPRDFIFAATMLSNAGSLVGNTDAILRDGSLTVNWAVPPAVFPGGRTQPVTVRLNRPGQNYLERWNQLDLQLKKIFRLGPSQVEPGIDLYNVFNSNAIMTTNQNYGPSLGNVMRIIQGRLVRITLQVKF
jgi:hypothetical protein